MPTQRSSQPSDNYGRVIQTFPSISRQSSTNSISALLNVAIPRGSLIAEITVKTNDVYIKAKTATNNTDVATTDNSWDRCLLAGNTYSVYLGANQGDITGLSIIPATGTSNITISIF